eukprot:284866_1
MGNLPITDKWIFQWLTSDAHIYATIGITMLAGVLHPILFGIYFYRKMIKTPTNSSPNTDSTRSKMNGNTHNILQRIIIVITLFAILFGWIASILSLFNILTLIASPTICQPFTIIQNVCWIFTKLCIYNVIIVRLQISFSGSVYQYNYKVFICGYSFVNIICIICIIGSIFDVESLHFITGWCLFIIPTWIILLPCCMDIICSICTLYLFIKPLRSVLHNNTSETQKSNISASEISELITKIILLTIAAVLSNLFGGIFFAITDIAIFTYLDTVINPICLVLMENVNKDIYQKICKCCHVKLHAIIHYKQIHSDTPGAHNKSSERQSELPHLPPNQTAIIRVYSDSVRTPPKPDQLDLRQLSTIHSEKILDQFMELTCTKSVKKDISNKNTINLNGIEQAIDNIGSNTNIINVNSTDIEPSIDKIGTTDIEKAIDNIGNAVNTIDIQTCTPETPLLIEDNIDDNVVNYKLAVMQHQILMELKRTANKQKLNECDKTTEKAQIKTCMFPVRTKILNLAIN